jgi:hypothetical protein
MIPIVFNMGGDPVMAGLVRCGRKIGTFGRSRGIPSVSVDRCRRSRLRSSNYRPKPS